MEKVQTWVAANKLDDKTMAEIIRNGFNSMEAVSLIEEDDIAEFTNPQAQKKLVPFKRH